MAHKNFTAVQAPEDEVKIVTGSFKGVNGSAPTTFKGCVRSATRTAEGIWSVVLRDSYPGTDAEGLTNVLFRAANVVGADADRAFFAALDVEAKTATIEAYTVSDVADDCDAKTVELLIIVRNSTSRRGS